MKNKTDLLYPSRAKLDEIRKRLSDPGVMGSSLLPDDATQIDRAKFKACEAIIKFRRKNELKQKDLAARLGIDQSRMSEILHYKIEGFTLDRLISYAQILYPDLKIDLTAA
jgi:predicted XRE-type DNA-binding protein